jgi:hypothetical protein
MLVRKKHRDLIASTEDRIKNVEECLKIFRQDIEYDVMPISDAFGPTITEEQIEALVVSAETVAGGQAGMLIIGILLNLRLALPFNTILNSKYREGKIGLGSSPTTCHRRYLTFHGICSRPRHICFENIFYMD